MTTLYYHPRKMVFARAQEDPLFWGKDGDLIPFQDAVSRSDSFQMKQKDACAGPLIGILVSKSKNSSVFGSRGFYEQIQSRLQEENGGLSFLFSLQDAGENTIEGYCYSPKKRGWLQAVFPYPDIVYNRISSRAEESAENFRDFGNRLKQRKIAFFNPHFIDKFQLYERFSNQPDISRYLPETILLQNKEDFTAFLDRHKDIYIKPASRSQGYGIRRILLKEEGVYSFCSPRNCRELSFAALWEEIEKAGETDKYIAQQTIASELYMERKYDYRVHAHFGCDNYQITGIGIRMARPGGITTHTSKGGETVPLPPHLKERAGRELQTLIQACGNALTAHYGFFGEFTADIGTDPGGNLYLFEINAKPMPFDEQDIEENKIRKLIDLFYRLSKFD